MPVITSPLLKGKATASLEVAPESIPRIYFN